jgi:mono/diheme cytochrome c family protein
MRTSVAPSHGRKPASITLRQLPLVAAFMILTPALALGQGSTTTTTTAPAAAAAVTTAEGTAATTTDTAAVPAAAVVPAGTVSSYTDEQATRGKPAYTDNCSVCHGTTLGGSGETPALAGKGFRERWFIGSPQPFFDYIHSNMPQQAPGSLDPQTYADIGAYLMSRNHVPAGTAELPPDDASLANIVLPPLN